MISGGRVRRLSAGSPIEASPCVRIEKRCPRQLRRATARMVYQGTQLVRIAVNGNEVRDSTVGGKLHNIVEKPSIVSTSSMSFDDNYVANAAPQLVDPMHLQPHAAGPRPSRASRDERSLPQSWKHEDSNWKYQTHIRALAKIRGIKEYTIPDSDFNNSHGEMVHRELRKLMGHERKAQKHLAATPEVKLEGIKASRTPTSETDQPPMARLYLASSSLANPSVHATNGSTMLVNSPKIGHQLPEKQESSFRTSLTSPGEEEQRNRLHYARLPHHPKDPGISTPVAQGSFAFWTCNEGGYNGFTGRRASAKSASQFSTSATLPPSSTGSSFDNDVKDIP
ncbi:hypothetical protein BKA70DRAFT_1577494 [Coprinopsis sp. MPI-PUGE-AT-0042]|nr:hypothetical protein BKA70DRAFT_1577494 [Coprinopsis sp. MPI-PUGE-AT-0042]